MNHAPSIRRIGLPILTAAIVASQSSCLSTYHGGDGGRQHKHAGIFVDIDKRSGLRFRHHTGSYGGFFFLESTGAGCALFDFDNDGWLDVLLLQSGPLPGSDRSKYNKEEVEARNGLYRNRGDGTFEDITAGSGVEHSGYSQGVAIGDFDNDGYDDILVTAYGRCYLFRNLNGSGKFEDVTATAGVTDTEFGPRWATSAG